MALQARQLALARGGRRLFAELDFQVTPGSVLHVTGPNGSGKSSLLRVLCGLWSPTAGEVQWHGQTRAAQACRWGREVSYLGHDNGLKADLTPTENLCWAAALRGQAITPRQASTALERIGLCLPRGRLTGALSQGQQRRVALARLALPLEPGRLWVLDEPFNALDTEAVAWVLTCLQARLQGGDCVVYTAHGPLGQLSAPVAQLALGVQ